MTTIQAPTVALLASPGMGHLIPIGEFAKLLCHRHGFSATIFSASCGPPSPAHQAYIHSLPETVTSVILPPVPLHDQLPATHEVFILHTMSRSVPHLRHAVGELMATTRVVALIVDLFGTDSFTVAREFGIPPYILFPSTCTSLSLILYMPQLGESVKGEYRDLEEPVRLPGCVPFNVTDLPTSFQERNSYSYGEFVKKSRQYKEASGIFVNNFAAMELGPITALKKMEHAKEKFPPVFPVGPLVRKETGEDKSACFKWLDKQPASSVVFVCFGSGGVLSSEQLSELALGLELSGQRFLWVARRPNDGQADSGVFTAGSGVDELDFLPEGFLRRTESLSMVVPSWAPQEQVLAHPATGGFVSHCGWNSTLESVTNGVPMVAWPLYAEQRMNAVMLSEEVGVAVRPKENERGVVEREEVGRVVRELIQGEVGKQLRHRMLQLKESGKAALATGGSSDTTLSEALMEGFLRRTESLSMVVPSSTPHEQVLAHPTTGGFVSQCGWNSMLESVKNGVLIVAWPLHAEQRMNVVMLSEEVGVALRPKENERGVVEREEVGRVVRELIQGEVGKQLRLRMLQLKENGKAVLATGGSSDTALSDVVKGWNIND